MNIVEKFLQSLQSDTTVKQYRSVLQLYDSYCTEKGMQFDSSDSVNEYFTYLKRSKVSTSTLKNRIAVIRSYFQWQGIPVSEFPIPKGDDSVPIDGLSDDEARRILASIDEDAEHGKMHSALIHLMLFTGIRCSEARSVQVGSIRQDGEFHVLTIIGKGNKIRQIGLNQLVVDKIEACKSTYARIDMRETGNSSSENLFLFSVDGGKNPIHQQTIRNIILKLVKKAGITKNISPHSLRVTAVSNAIAVGCPLPTVMQMGGWSSLEMVLRYDRRSKLIQNSAALKINYGSK